jgi:hypothetical protein
MKWRSLGVGLALGLIFVGGWLGRKSIHSGLSVSEVSEQVEANRQGKDDKDVSESDISDDASPSPAPSNGVSSPALRFPTMDEVRAEVAKNPHATPPVLLDFARAMAPKMTEALQSSDPQVVVRMAFALKSCAISDSAQAVPQVQSQCLRNLQRLAEAKKDLLPSLGGDLQEALDRAPAEAKRILNAAKSIEEHRGF